MRSATPTTSCASAPRPFAPPSHRCTVRQRRPVRRTACFVALARRRLGVSACRWQFYFAYCEGAFDCRYIHDYQIVWQRGESDTACSAALLHRAAPQLAAGGRNTSSADDAPGLLGSSAVTWALFGVYCVLAGIVIARQPRMLVAALTFAVGQCLQLVRLHKLRAFDHRAYKRRRCQRALDPVQCDRGAAAGDATLHTPRAAGIRTAAACGPARVERGLRRGLHRGARGSLGLQPPGVQQQLGAGAAAQRPCQWPILAGAAPFASEPACAR